jgi:translation initiation factor IF-1
LTAYLKNSVTRAVEPLSVIAWRVACLGAMRRMSKVALCDSRVRLSHIRQHVTVRVYTNTVHSCLARLSRRLRATRFRMRQRRNG